MTIRKVVLVVSLLAVGSANAIAIGIGVKTEFTGGPLFSVVGMTKLPNKLSLNVSVGGFPGIIMRAESNLRLSKEKKWSLYTQGGFGWTRIFRGSGENKNVMDVHFNIGISRYFPPSLNLSAGIGLLYAPYWANPWFKEKFSDVIPVAPMVSLEVVYGIK